MSISTDDLGRITQQTSVVSSDGDKLGTINQIYTSDTTGEPAWVTLKTGLFGTQESFVPLADASFDGDDIRVPVTKKAVHDAPRVDADGHLSVEEEDDLYRYYGLHNPGGNDVPDRHDEFDGRDGSDGSDLHDGSDDRDTHGGRPAAVAAGTAGVAAAAAGRDRDDERDVQGRDQPADPVTPGDGRTQDDGRSVHAEDGTEQVDRTSAGSADEPVRPGERTTQLRRYVVTERVVQTIEELPDEPSR